MVDPTDIKRIIRRYYEQLYSNTFNNSYGIDELRKKKNLSKLMNKKQKILKSTKSIKAPKFINKNLSTLKNPHTDAFIGEFYKYLSDN